MCSVQEQSPGRYPGSVRDGYCRISGTTHIMYIYQHYSSSSNQVSRGGNYGGRNGNHGHGRGGRAPMGHGNGGNNSNGDNDENNFGNGENYYNNNNNNNRPTCQVCSKRGHEALRCYNRFNHAYQADEKIAAAVGVSSYLTDTNWYADSGATDHITSYLDRLTMKLRYNGTDQVHVASGIGLSISNVGQPIITGSNRSLVLNNVLHVPSISKHQISVHKLTSDNDVFIEFHHDFFYIKDQTTKKVIL